MDNEPVQPLLRAISVKTVGPVGTSQLKIFVMENIKKFPRGILDQVISGVVFSSRAAGTRAPGPGLMLPDSKMVKQRATSSTSRDQERQASSSRRQAFEPTCSSIKQQASSPQASASSAKPQAASSEIREPRNMDTGEVLGEQGPRVFAKIKVL